MEAQGRVHLRRAARQAEEVAVAVHAAPRQERQAALGEEHPHRQLGAQHQQPPDVEQWPQQQLQQSRADPNLHATTLRSFS